MADGGHVTLQEAASLLGVSRGTLRNWDKSGQLKAVRHPVNRYRLYRMDDVLALQRQTTLFEEPPGAKGQFDEHRSLDAAGFRRVIRILHKILRDDEGNSSLVERFDELTKIIYCKLFDEQTHHSDRAYRAFESDLTVRAGAIRMLYTSLVAANPALFPERFARIRLKNSTLVRMSEVLEAVELSSADEDLKGLAYEELIRNTFDKGDNQQFFTPRPIVEFMIQMVAERLRGNICDPACGTGGFLVYAGQWARRFLTPREYSLTGIEVDERLAWAAGMNLAMHGAPHFRIVYASGSGSLGPDLPERVGPMDAIVTNPPFGSDVADQASLQQFVLGRRRSSRRRGALFIERCIDMLRPGGTLAIIIDDGVLNGASNTDVRALISERCWVRAVISLPSTAFMPYASVKASILILEPWKVSTQPQADSPTFFGDADNVGRKPNGDPLFRPARSGPGVELDSDLPDILECWRMAALRGSLNRHNDKCFIQQLPEFGDAAFAESGYRLDLAFHHPSRRLAAECLLKSTVPMTTLGAVCAPREEALLPSVEMGDGELCYIGLANIDSSTGTCRPSLVPAASLKSAVRRCQGGDILFSKLRPELRKVCIVPMQLDEAYASSECLVLNVRSDRTGAPVYIPRLLALWLRSDQCYGQFMHMVTGIGRPRISRSTILSVRVPLPSLSEQERILASYARAHEASETLVRESQRLQREAVKVRADGLAQLANQLLSLVPGS